MFTASFGVTDSTRASALQDLIRLADMGLYASKAGGRDRITIGGPVDITADVHAAGMTGSGARTEQLRQVSDTHGV